MPLGEVNPIALPMGLPGFAPAGRETGSGAGVGLARLTVAVKACGLAGMRADWLACGLAATPGRWRHLRRVYGASPRCNSNRA
jgi:hypothetical protein